MRHSPETFSSADENWKIRITVALRIHVAVDATFSEHRLFKYVDDDDDDDDSSGRRGVFR
jgi:hypothetical protein